jgi:large subunit ribosomal protein L10
MPRPDKEKRVEELRERFSRNPSLVVTEYRGLTVEELAELRKLLKGSDVEFKVVKNTLARLAVKGTEQEPLLEMLEGPVALAFAYGDMVKAAQSLTAYARRNPNLKIKGGFIEGRLVQAADVRAVATLPPREVLLARVVGGMQAPISGLVGVLSGPIRGLAQALKALAEQREKAA